MYYTHRGVSQNILGQRGNDGALCEEEPVGTEADRMEKCEWREQRQVRL